MELDYSRFKSQLEEAMNSSYHMDIENVRSWTSMQSLIAVSAIDEHYDVLIDHEEMAAIDSLDQLFTLVSQKTA